jgi:hypothetical protein
MVFDMISNCLRGGGGMQGERVKPHVQGRRHGLNSGGSILASGAERAKKIFWDPHLFWTPRLSVFCTNTGSKGGGGLESFIDTIFCDLISDSSTYSSICMKITKSGFRRFS